jgi:hypothetical protein
MEKGLNEAQIKKCAYLEDIYSHDKESHQDLLNIIKAYAMCILKLPLQFDKLFLLHEFYCNQSSFTQKLHILIAIVLQWAFTNYCNCVCANKILSIVYCLKISRKTFLGYVYMQYILN